MRHTRGVYEPTAQTELRAAEPLPAAIPAWKRMIDISVILLLSPLVLPLTLLVALIVKLGSRGDVLFKQERIGLKGRHFTLFKFRTMIAGNDSTVHEAYVDALIASNLPMTKLDAAGDPRLIPFGRILRTVGFDELPQLLNVLRGEMSLVGPRPCLPSEFVRYSPAQRERFDTLPGLTGLWQVSGKNRLTFTEMVDRDIEYVRTKSWRVDLAILLRTLPALVREVKTMRDSRSAKIRPGNIESGKTDPANTD